MILKTVLFICCFVAVHDSAEWTNSLTHIVTPALDTGGGHYLFGSHQSLIMIRHH